VSAHDPTAALLGGIERPVDPRPEFADGLLDRLLVELGRPRRQMIRARTLLLAAALLLLLAGVATATYLIERTAAVAPLDTPPGTLTLIDQASNGVAKIVAVLPGGRTRVVWRCPGHVKFCGDLTSVDWSLDGRRVAFTLDEIGGRSAYVGLHILDVQTGRDLHIPNTDSLAHPLAPAQPDTVLRALGKQLLARLGCFIPADVAWSPDGRRLAYGCRDGVGGSPARIYTIASNGAGRRLLHTGTRNAFDPSWSPDGRKIVFATDGRPPSSSIYSVRLDGTGRKLVARNAATPDWSPDGSVIAYDSPDGIRLASPSGVDLTPRPGRIAPPGVPSWSPDGSQIAVATQGGTVLVDTGTWSQTIATSAMPEALYGYGRSGRPAWYPGSGPPQLRGTRQFAPHCRSCL
jgi:dipeptidyl aminopeptidase/acylaminoacyl peptidase